MCQHVRGRQRGLSRKGFIPKMLVERSSMCEAGSVDRLSVGAFVGVKLGGGIRGFVCMTVTRLSAIRHLAQAFVA